MKKETLVLLSGFLLVLLPNLGIPDDFKRIGTMVLGAALLLAGYLLVRDRLRTHTDLGNGERETDTFIETTTPLFKDE